MNFEKYEIPVEELDEYEKKVMDADSLLQILEVIYDMFKKLMSAVKVTKGKTNKSTTDSTGEKSVNTEEYHNLEKLVQKYEAEIRNHIRIEQQLKIYTESIQEKFDDKEKRINENLLETSNQLKEITHERNDIKKKLDEMTRDNIRLREMVSATIPNKKNLKIENLFNHRSANSIDHSHQGLVPTKAKKLKDLKRSLSRQKSRDASPVDLAKSSVHNTHSTHTHEKIYETKKYNDLMKTSKGLNNS